MRRLAQGVVQTDYSRTRHGGTGRDSLNGGGRNDILYGDGGVDTLDGHGGADTIYADPIDIIKTPRDPSDIIITRTSLRSDPQGSVRKYDGKFTAPTTYVSRVMRSSDTSSATTVNYPIISTGPNPTVLTDKLFGSFDDVLDARTKEIKKK